MHAQQKLDIANTLILVSFLAMLTAIGSAYLWGTDQHLILQGIAHLSILLLAVVLKLSYVLRLYALKCLGLAVN